MREEYRADGAGVYGGDTFTRPEGRNHESDGDDDFALGVARFEMPDRLGDFAHSVLRTDDRSDLPGLNELLQDDQVILAVRMNQWA